jgi:predicted O-methyltransferase YrrM
MPLKSLTIAFDDAPIPADVSSLIREADRRIEAFQRDARIPGFIPCDFRLAYRFLKQLADSDMTPGKLFCEWGSGFGVVTCLASLLDFDAVGIEIEPELVDEANQLAEQFDLPVEFFEGSFLPKGCTLGSTLGTGSSWLKTEECDPATEFGLEPRDFDVIFAYPWPDDEEGTARLFEKHAAVGALFASYHGGDDFRLLRKVSAGKRRAR